MRCYNVALLTLYTPNSINRMIKSGFTDFCATVSGLRSRVPQWQQNVQDIFKTKASKLSETDSDSHYTTIMIRTTKIALVLRVDETPRMRAAVTVQLLA